MTAYYNENDRAAAAWLRNNIAAGLIAPGYVDDRSIKDVQPSDLEGFTQVHLFAGIGVWSYAARSAGWRDDRPLWTASCPCQPYSVAGKREGDADPRNLWPDVRRLARARRPALIVGEQVSGSAGVRWFDGVRADLENQGFASRAVDVPACAIDAPHQRNRLYWLAVRQQLLGHGSEQGSQGVTDSGGIAGGASGRADAERADGRDGGPRAVGDGYGPRQFQCEGSEGLQRLGGRRAGDADGRIGSYVADRQGSIGRAGLREDRPQFHGDIASDCHGDEHVADSVGRGRRADEPGSRPEGRTASGRDHASLQPDARGRGIRGIRPAEDHQSPAGAGGKAWEQRVRTDAGTGNVARRNGSWWAGADWIMCHDDKARRVADARAPLLVNGVAGGIPVHRPESVAATFAEGEGVRMVSRVAAWKGFGNAIVAPLATEFIASIMDSIDAGEIVLCP